MSETNKLVGTLVVRIKTKLSLWSAIKMRIAGVCFPKKKMSTEEQMYAAGIWERKHA